MAREQIEAANRVSTATDGDAPTRRARMTETKPSAPPPEDDAPEPRAESKALPAR